MKQETKQIPVWMQMAVESLLLKMKWCLGFVLVGGLWGSFAQTAAALSLGTMDMISKKNEPLYLAIELIEETPKEADSALVFLAEPKAFENVGLTYFPFLQDIHFAIKRVGTGQVFVYLTSEKPVLQDRFSLLVNTKQNGVQEQRRYKIDLSSGVTAASAQQASVPTESVQQEEQVLVSPQEPVAEKPEPVMLKVQSGDTISEIAQRYRKDASIPLNQIMAAIYFNNSAAFPKRDINFIRAGQRIRLPDSEEINAVTKAQVSEVRRMLSENFNAYRQKLAQQSKALPDASPSQESKGVITTAVEEISTQPLDTLTLLQGDDTATEGKLAQDRQDALITQRQTELEQNIRDLQNLDTAVLETAVVEAGTGANSTGNDNDNIIQTETVTTPEVAMKPILSEEPMPSSLSERWRDWLPYGLFVLAGILGLWSLVRLLRKDETTGAPNSNIDDNNTDADAATPPSDPLQFSVSNQRFDLSGVDLDLDKTKQPDTKDKDV